MKLISRQLLFTTLNSVFSSIIYQQLLWKGYGLLVYISVF